MIMEPGSPEWHAARAQGIGGSDIAAICELSKFTTPLDVWKVKTGRAEPQPESPAMEWGHRLESAVLGKFADNHGTVERYPLLPAMHHHPNVPIARASLDGMLRLDDGSGEPVDAKTTRMSWDSIPGDYFMQMQWQMGVTGTKAAWLAVLRSGRDYEEHRIEFDRILFNDALEYAQIWWRDHVLADEPPPATLNDDLATAFTPKPGLRAEVGRELWDPYLEARAAVKRATDWLEMVEADVKLAVGSATEVVVDGEVVATWRPRKPTVSVDRKKLETEFPDVFASVVKNGKESRTWLVK